MSEVGKKNTYFLFPGLDLEAASDYSPYFRLALALHSRIDDEVYCQEALSLKGL